MPFSTMPSDETMRILSDIHTLQVVANELVGKIQGFRTGEITLKTREVVQLLDDCNATLKAQGTMLVSLVENQLKLDEKLQDLVATMEEGAEDGDAVRN